MGHKRQAVDLRLSSIHVPAPCRGGTTWPSLNKGTGYVESHKQIRTFYTTVVTRRGSPTIAWTITLRYCSEASCSTLGRRGGLRQCVYGKNDTARIHIGPSMEQLQAGFYCSNQPATTKTARNHAYGSRCMDKEDARGGVEHSTLRTTRVGKLRHDEHAQRVGLRRQSRYSRGHVRSTSVRLHNDA